LQFVQGSVEVTLQFIVVLTEVETTNELLQQFQFSLCLINMPTFRNRTHIITVDRIYTC